MVYILHEPTSKDNNRNLNESIDLPERMAQKTPQQEKRVLSCILEEKASVTSPALKSPILCFLFFCFFFFFCSLLTKNKKNKPKNDFQKKMPIVYGDQIRQDVATRLSAGQSTKSIADTLNLSLKTVYRMKNSFIKDGASYVAQPREKTPKKKVKREQLVRLSEMMTNSPKTTLHELIQKAVEEGVFESLETAPDVSTVYRKLRRAGFKWQKPKYSDPRSKSTRIQFERCCFRKLQQSDGTKMDPAGRLLSIDESNFYDQGAEQATRAWGTEYKAPTLDKPKGKTPRMSMVATIAFDVVAGEPKAFVHWTIIHGRKSYKPLEERIAQWEIEPTEKTKLKEYLTSDFVKSLSAQGLKKEPKELGLRAPETSAASVREVLLRIARTGTRLNELRARDRGRPSAGGQIVPPTGNSHMISEYLHQLLGIYLHNGELVGEGNNTCELSSDLGIRGCPSGGKREFRPNVRQMSVLWDNAPSHQPTTSKRVSPFQKWVQDKLGLKGVIHTPPYSAWFNPVELFFSYVKRPTICPQIRTKGLDRNASAN